MCLYIDGLFISWLGALDTFGVPHTQWTAPTVGVYHAGDNSCLPPEPVSGVRLRPHRAVPLHARPEIIATFFKSRGGYGDVALPQMTARNNALRKLVGFTT